MKLKHGHIYFVEFSPSSGHEFQKVRPAVIVSSDELIHRSHLITCVPYTGNTGNVVAEDDVLIKKSKQNNLFCDSIMKTHHISTFDKRRVKKYVGELEKQSLHNLKAILIRNFSLCT